MQEPAGGAVRVDGHAADWIERKLAVCRLALADRREDLDRLANVAQPFATTRLIEDASEVGGERCGVARQQDLATACQAGDACPEG